MNRPSFTSHNVVLPDGTCTMGGSKVADSPCCRIALRELDKKFGQKGEGRTLIDLGSLEGGYAVEFARRGYDVTGIEGRQENHEKAAWLQENMGLPNLHFECEDVRNALRGREFDVTFCSGLLYHMDKPVSFLAQVGASTRQMLILNTHVSQEGGHPEGAHHPESYCDYSETVNEGRSGHWYYEEDSRWASFINRKSFWLKKNELFAVLYEVGFDNVNEIEDWRDNEIGWNLRHVPGGAGLWEDRIMLTAVKA